MSSYDNYEDIVGLPHHRSATRKPMPVEARAAQFAAFAALNGHSEAISEQSRVTDTFVEPDAEARQCIASALRELAGRLDETPPVSIVVFRPDALKAGGSVETVEGRVRKFDEFGRILSLTDGRTVEIDMILDIILI